jgi:excinuclease ABC subunit A
MPPVISVRGARQNTLKNLSFDLPLNQLIVVTGLSGSGKSSLAFDTLYAEGQRRYTETFSPYTRQFLERMDKPQVDRIDGIPPAIAISQANAVRTSRSTVGTMTEIADYLKMLFPRVAKLICPKCGREVRKWSTQEIVADLEKNAAGRSVLVLFEVPFPAATSWTDAAAFLQAQGFRRVWIDNHVVRTDDAEPAGFKALAATAPKKKGSSFYLPVVQDRITIEDASRGRLGEAIHSALQFGKGIVSFTDAGSGGRENLDLRYSDKWVCPWDRTTFSEPTPAQFAFNSPVAACPDCRGFGRSVEIDYELAMPDRKLSVAQGVVKPFQTGMAQECQKSLVKGCKKHGVPTTVPFYQLNAAQQKFIIHGVVSEKKPLSEVWDSGEWYGVKGYFDWLETKTYKMHVRVLLSRYRAYRTCPSCHGTRFRPEIERWRLEGKTLPEINAMPLSELAPFFQTLSTEDESATVLLDQIRGRLGYLVDVGLGYLNLNRTTRTLSGGEVQRVNLTTCLGTSLLGTLFILDEPSIGLHPRDTGLLLRILRKLRDQGNTVMVVEHDGAVMAAADHLLELGPGRGEAGGDLVYQGDIQGLIKDKNSITGAYLSGKKQIPLPDIRRELDGCGWLEFKGASKNNLKAIDVRLPLRRFTAVTGVSGSGKSTFVHDILHKHLLMHLQRPADEPGKVKSLKGAAPVGDVVLVDQSPLTQTPRSTPLLYLGVYEAVREMFAATEEAQRQGLNAASFSFNGGTGRCERCNGMGYEKISMQFLSDLHVLCPVCEGKRFQDHVLKIRYRKKTVSDILGMTIQEGLDFFGGDLRTLGVKEQALSKKVANGLQLLADVGLSYIKLGQPISQLSGGEAQRLKLVGHLSGRITSGDEDLDISPSEDPQSEIPAPQSTKVLILDEPTTGLHFDDIHVLVGVLQRLVDRGHTLVVIEHNLDVIKCADWIVDLGPEAGDAGGNVVAMGRPEEIVKIKESVTGQFLKPFLGTKSHRVMEQALVVSKKKEARPRTDVISIQGARHHNLKNVSIDIPLNKMVVLTGLSGSGKSTLAFDLLFSEGQRRYLDCLNSYARQFVEQLERPAVDAIHGIPPAVAIEQRTTRGGSKSTVATVTEIYHFLRLLYAKLGVQHDPDSDEPAIRQTNGEITARIRDDLKKEKELTLLAPLIKGRKGFHTEIAKWAEKKGYHALRVDGKWIEPEKFKALDRFKEHTIDVVIGNISLKSPDLDTLIRNGLQIGHGTLYTLDNKQRQTIHSNQLYCPGTGRSFDELEPRLFSFNSPHGWCTACEGYGTLVEVKVDAEDEAEREQQVELAREAADSDEARPCPTCHGTRLNPLARAVRFAGQPVVDINRMNVKEVEAFFLKLKLKGREASIARDLLPEIRQRLHFLRHVGLDYLSLDRSAPTLSGGESQRIRLAAQLGSNLQGVLYVLDEPTIGLHPRDNEKLIETLMDLKSRGNSLVIVEHDEETMRAADYIIDLGPGAGVNGGNIVAQGHWKEIAHDVKSVTGTLIGEPMKHPLRGERRPVPAAKKDWLHIEGARANNLRKIDASIPLQRLTVITGVSGSGKSSLMREVLLPAVTQSLQKAQGKAPDKKAAMRPWDKVTGAEELARVVEVDQSPIGKTSRSAVATYIGLMDPIRDLFAQMPEARVRGFTPAHFSFNAGQGRCPACAGQGAIKVEMNFLPSVFVPCETCSGKRYRDELLQVTFRDKSVNDVLKMSIDEAVMFFESQPSLQIPLKLLQETGLGYITLGQTSPTLSGGEAQRLKLVAELAIPAAAEVRRKLKQGIKKTDQVLYILEEPTVGLHLADVRRLIEILQRLVDSGHTVVVIEHNLDVIAEADYLIDIGPESGPEGGTIVCAGTPETVAAHKTSHTARYLKPMLGKYVRKH